MGEEYQPEDVGFFDFAGLPGVKLPNVRPVFNKNTSQYLIVENGKVKGTMITKPRSKDTTEIKSLYILPEYRKTGIGTKVTEAVLKNPNIKKIVGVSAIKAKEYWKKRGAIQKGSAEELDAMREHREQGLKTVREAFKEGRFGDDMKEIIPDYVTYDDLTPEVKETIDKSGWSFEISKDKFRKTQPTTVYSWQNKEDKVYPAELQEEPELRYPHRSTGHFGTGIYAYKNKGSAMREKDRYKNRKLIKVEITNPLMVKGSAMVGYEFHDALKQIQKINPKTRKIEKEGFGGNIYTDSLSKIQKEFEHQGIDDISEDELIEAYKEWKKTGVQPANIILKKRGYGGIIPEHKTLDTHGYGSVKFEDKPIPYKDFEEVEERPIEKPETLQSLDENDNQIPDMAENVDIKPINLEDKDEE